MDFDSVKRGKTESWANQTEPLADGQLGYDKDTHELKIGDGSTAFANLPSVGNIDISGKEDKSNKVTSISSTNTDDQYLSAKSVYTVVNAKEPAKNKVTSLSQSSTNTQYPGAKLVYDQLALKQTAEYKTTSVSSSSTDTYYSSAKAVYTFVNNNYANVTSGRCTLTMYTSSATSSKVNTFICNYYKCGKLVTVYGTLGTANNWIYMISGLPYVVQGISYFSWGQSGIYAYGIASAINSSIIGLYRVDCGSTSREITLDCHYDSTKMKQT